MTKRKYEPILVVWDDAEVSNDWAIQNEGEQTVHKVSIGKPK